MPFDGLSPERPHVVPAPQENPLSEAEARAQQADVQVRAAQKEVDTFFELALSGNRLSDDEKTILARLKEDQRLEKLDEPVPENNGYTHRDYLLADAEDIVMGIEKRYRARMAASDAQVQAIRALEMLKHPPRQEAVMKMPTLPRVETPKLTLSREEVEARLKSEWEQYDARLKAHLQRIQESLREPIEMNVPRQRPEVAVVLEEEVPNDPFAVQAESMPRVQVGQRINQPSVPVIETPPSPYVFADSREQTVVMPAMNEQTKKPGLLSRLFS